MNNAQNVAPVPEIQSATHSPTRETPDLHRYFLISRLAAARADLLWRLLGLDEQTLTEVPVLDDWTVKDILAHIAAWDRWEHQTMRQMIEGKAPDFTAAQDVDRFNAAVIAVWRVRTLDEVLAELEDARAAWVAWLQSLPVEEFFQRRRYGNDEWFFPDCLRIQWEHDT
ncbi:MAG: ClbS/DfsB family four-helix bundle protein, partial [Anaerolineae bacterium]|nr:ClbS/DfsB family four-helix bundle protein [Anaerolineae bacterium]